MNEPFLYRIESRYGEATRYAVFYGGKRVGEVYRRRHHPQSRSGCRDYVRRGYWSWHKDSGRPYEHRAHYLTRHQAVQALIEP